MSQTATIKMYKKNPCPFCDRAKSLLDEKGLKYEVVDLTNNIVELEALKAKTGWKTVPMIFINNELIGGYTDLKNLDEEGKLDSLVTA